VVIAAYAPQIVLLQVVDRRFVSKPSVARVRIDELLGIERIKDSGRALPHRTPNYKWLQD
jgi:hypothetical protein